MSLKEPSESKSQSTDPYIIAISVVAVSGIVLMLGGAIALKNGAEFNQDMIGIFMLMTFLIVGSVEFSLCRQLSRLNRAAEKKQLAPPLPAAMPAESFSPQPRALAQPVQSVTENTTRTLEYSRSEPFEH